MHAKRKLPRVIELNGKSIIRNRCVMCAQHCQLFHQAGKSKLIGFDEELLHADVTSTDNNPEHLAINIKPNP